MTKAANKILGCILITVIFAIIMSILSFSAAAAESGTCGDNLTWTLDDNGTLTISGTGDMENYYDNDAPWVDNSSSITSVIIENGVTSIGAIAFEGCYGLTSVNLPNSVTRH